jgi:hypothetical protein
MVGMPGGGGVGTRFIMDGSIPELSSAASYPCFAAWGRGEGPFRALLKILCTHAAWLTFSSLRGCLSIDTVKKYHCDSLLLCSQRELLLTVRNSVLTRSVTYLIALQLGTVATVNCYNMEKDQLIYRSLVPKRNLFWKITIVSQNGSARAEVHVKFYDSWYAIIGRNFCLDPYYAKPRLIQSSASEIDWEFKKMFCSSQTHR